MNDNRYKECLNKIDKYYKSNPDITTNELEKTIYNIEYNVLTKNSSIGPKKILDVDIIWIYRVAFVIIVLAIGLVDILNNSFDGTYYFGAIFYLAGLFIGLNIKGVGLIFLLSHGGTGIGIMLVPTIINILKNPLMSDLANNNIMSILVIAFIAIVLAILMTVFYNLSDQFKNKNYSLPVILLLYIIGIVIIKIIPIIYNIHIDNVF